MVTWLLTAYCGCDRLYRFVVCVGRFRRRWEDKRFIYLVWLINFVNRQQIPAKMLG